MLVRITRKLKILWLRQRISKDSFARFPDIFHPFGVRSKIFDPIPKIHGVFRPSDAICTFICGRTRSWVVERNAIFNEFSIVSHSMARNLAKIKISDGETTKEEDRERERKEKKGRESQDDLSIRLKLIRNVPSA